MLRSDHLARNRSSRAVTEIAPVLVPQMGLEVTEATVLEVLVAVGDEVAEGQPLFEIETEKATTEVLAPCAGFVITIEVTPGDDVPVGAVLASVGASAGLGVLAAPVARRAAAK